jgi:flagellar FliJ protein
MTRPTDWRRLVKLAEERRDASAQRLAEFAAARDAARNKLEMLIDYRREYDNRLARSIGTGIDTDKLRGYRAFLANLERAIAQQNDILAGADERVAQAQVAWREQQRQVESFQVLDRRHVDARARADDRRAQKLADEIAMRTLAPSAGFGD